jgi:hypothetical protein
VASYARGGVYSATDEASEPLLVALQALSEQDAPKPVRTLEKQRFVAEDTVVDA